MRDRRPKPRSAGIGCIRVAQSGQQAYTFAEVPGAGARRKSVEGDENARNCLPNQWRRALQFLTDLSKARLEFRLRFQLRGEPRGMQVIVGPEVVKMRRGILVESG